MCKSAFFLRAFLAAFLLAVLFCTKTQAQERVLVGAYINGIQDIDLRAHSSRLDLYIWFRWRDPSFNPAKTAEFMNAANPSEHARTLLYDKPLKMPDGSLYTIIREQGPFSAKFPLQNYPFDRQVLEVEIEDSVHADSELVYVPDAQPVLINGQADMPGYEIGTPSLQVTAHPYHTNFGDLSAQGDQTYSRAKIAIPVVRPHLTTGMKVFFPVILILICTAMVFFVHPVYIEAKLGVAITALLTLVALQLTTANALPEVDYLLLTDKIYFLSYLFIIATLMQAVRISGMVQQKDFEAAKLSNRQTLRLLLGGFAAGLAFIALTA